MIILKAATAAGNQLKNQSFDFLPIDSTRVKLPLLDDQVNSMTMIMMIMIFMILMMTMMILMMILMMTIMILMMMKTL